MGSLLIGFVSDFKPQYSDRINGINRIRKNRWLVSWKSCKSCQNRRPFGNGGL